MPDHGTQFTSWSFTERIRAGGPMLSFGSVGDGLDNAMAEYVETFHDRRRRHSQLGYLSPIACERTSTAPLIPA